MPVPQFRPGRYTPVVEFCYDDSSIEDENTMVLNGSIENGFCAADQDSVAFLSDLHPEIKLGDNIFDYTQDFLPSNYRWEYPGYAESVDNDNFSEVGSDASVETVLTIPDDDSRDKFEVVNYLSGPTTDDSIVSPVVGAYTVHPETPTQVTLSPVPAECPHCVKVREELRLLRAQVSALNAKLHASECDAAQMQSKLLQVQDELFRKDIQLIVRDTHISIFRSFHDTCRKVKGKDVTSLPP